MTSRFILSKTRSATYHKHIFSELQAYRPLSTKTRFLPCSVVQNHVFKRFSSYWQKVPLAEPDAILGITEKYKNDKFPEKINLGVGAYRDDDSLPFVLESVKLAEHKLLSLNLDKEYLTILGDLEFISYAKKLAFSLNCSKFKEIDLDCIASAQSISGTGALRLGGEFLSRFHFNKTIYLPVPTWGNHTPIFKDSNLDVKTYKYYDSKNISLNFEGFIQDISNMDKGSIILLHACAHNPTGIDPTSSQWTQLAELVKKKELVAFFDMAYQGFASGDIAKDAYAVNLFVDEGISVLLAQSFAKNMGLYGERVGLFSIVTKSKNEKINVESQLKKIIRPMYSNPPLQGARIAKLVLSDETLRKKWVNEVCNMANRISKMRELLYEKLKQLGSDKDWNHIKNQIGMFCYTGLSKSQVETLINDYHVYLTKDGRISIAGITSKNVPYLAEAIHKVTS